MFPLAHPEMSCCFEHTTEYVRFAHLCGRAAVLGQRQEMTMLADEFIKDIIWFVSNCWF